MCMINAAKFLKNGLSPSVCEGLVTDKIEIDVVVQIEANEVGKYLTVNCEWIAPDGTIHSHWAPIQIPKSVGSYDFIIPVTLTGTGIYTIRNYFVWDNVANTILCIGKNGVGGCSSIRLTGMTGSINCTTTPSDAAIYLDGVYLNKFTPTILTGISAGSHTVKYSKTGYNDCQVTVTVAANSTVNAPCTLTSITPTPTLNSITISPDSVTVGIGKTKQLNAVCKDQNGNIQTCPTLIWSSNNTPIAIVSSTGLVTGVNVGTAIINSVSGSITSNVSTITVVKEEEEKIGAGVILIGLGLAALVMLTRR